VNQYILVLDCGATTLRAVAVGMKGEILAISALPNAPRLQSGCEDCLIWDLDEIWNKFLQIIPKVRSQVNGKVVAVTVTTFGADGTTVKKDGTLTYPVISWQCSRTTEWAKRIASLISPREIFRLTGYQIIPFNTIIKLLWMRENVPEALDEADTYMMMPGLLSYKLCGEMSFDYPSASTTMMIDIRTKKWSERLLSLVGLDETFFPPFLPSGGVIGRITEKVSSETGIPLGIPVIAAGHDTQFALIGSMADQSEMVLSSGTWEIAAIRILEYRDSERAFETGIMTEFDAVDGLWDPQMLMMAGGVVEWVRRNFFADIKDRSDIYSLMIDNAREIEPGSGGVTVVPSFMPSGPNKPYETQGTILGLGLTTDRSQVYRAALEGLSFQLKQAVKAFYETFSFEPTAVRVVGGGSKNHLWNQIRADVLGLPVITTSCEEGTVLGAALFAMVGSGIARSIEEAKKMVEISTRVWEPSENWPYYQKLYEEYEKLPLFLASHYRNKI